MSLFGTFTLREWLSLSATGDVNDFFRKALRDNDEPMAVCTLAELIKRGDTDLVMQAIMEATEAGAFTLGSRFATSFANALTQLGDRDPIMRSVAKNVRKKGYWPSTRRELLEPFYGNPKNGPKAE